MLEKMKASLSKLSALAAAYLPAGFKNVLLEMAGEIDRLTAENQLLKEKQNEQNQ